MTGIFPTIHRWLYVNICAALACGYVEVVSLPMSPDPATQTFAFSADLPAGTYDVVAASDGFDPDTAANVNLGDTVNLTISPQGM